MTNSIPFLTVYNLQRLNLSEDLVKHLRYILILLNFLISSHIHATSKAPEDCASSADPSGPLYSKESVFYFELLSFRSKRAKEYIRSQSESLFGEGRGLEGIKTALEMSGKSFEQTFVEWIATTALQKEYDTSNSAHDFIFRNEAVTSSAPLWARGIDQFLKFSDFLFKKNSVKNLNKDRNSHEMVLNIAHKLSIFRMYAMDTERLIFGHSELKPFGPLDAKETAKLIESFEWYIEYELQVAANLESEYRKNHQLSNEQNSHKKVQVDEPPKFSSTPTSELRLEVDETSDFIQEQSPSSQRKEHEAQQTGISSYVALTLTEFLKKLKSDDLPKNFNQKEFEADSRHMGLIKIGFSEDFIAQLFASRGPHRAVLIKLLYSPYIETSNSGLKLMHDSKVVEFRAQNHGHYRLFGCKKGNKITIIKADNPIETSEYSRSLAHLCD